MEHGLKGLIESLRKVVDFSRHRFYDHSLVTLNITSTSVVALYLGKDVELATFPHLPLG
jgi:hypothetical protein